MEALNIRENPKRLKSLTIKKLDRIRKGGKSLRNDFRNEMK